MIFPYSLPPVSVEEVRDQTQGSEGKGLKVVGHGLGLRALKGISFPCFLAERNQKRASVATVRLQTFMDTSR